MEGAQSSAYANWIGTRVTLYGTYKSGGEAMVNFKLQCRIIIPQKSRSVGQMRIAGSRVILVVPVPLWSPPISVSAIGQASGALSPIAPSLHPAHSQPKVIERTLTFPKRLDQYQNREVAHPAPIVCEEPDSLCGIGRRTRAHTRLAPPIDVQTVPRWRKDRNNRDGGAEGSARSYKQEGHAVAFANQRMRWSYGPGSTVSTSTTSHAWRCTRPANRERSETTFKATCFRCPLDTWAGEKHALDENVGTTISPGMTNAKALKSAKWTYGRRPE
ncbi:hypothetical protein BJY52DRAFT_1227950 [Lactarius psammicola]|nr:hypothetical protein BJY52DRAFT_1227950 [Lactarius psammicola]